MPLAQGAKSGPDAALLGNLERNRAISAITKGYAVEVSINKIAVGALAASPIRGALLLSSVDGPVPDGDGQIGLGVTTMHQLGVHLGSVVEVTVTSPSGGERTVQFRVVSRISFPVLGGVVGLGRGAALTVDGYEVAVCPAGSSRPACLRALQSGPVSGGLLASVVAGRQGQAAVNYSSAPTNRSPRSRSLRRPWSTSAKQSTSR